MPNIETLATALAARLDVCSSEGAVSGVPQRLFSPFHLDYIGIIVCHEGTLTFRANERPYTAHGGETVFLTEGTTLQVQEASPSLRYSLLFYRVSTIRDIVGNTVITMRLYDTLNPQPVAILPTSQTEHIGTYISLIVTLPADGLPHFLGNEQRMLLLSLTYRLCDMFSRRSLIDGAAAGCKVDTFVKLIGLISKHYTRERTVAFYADKLCLTSKYLSTLVKTLCGYTVQDLVTKAIMRRAIFLVTNTDDDIQHITDELHFPNPSAFGTFFKKHAGMSPKLYRAQSK